jgi:uncharacterized iron-regulated membrane protein
MKSRQLLLWLHRWAGVLAGLVILVLALTGGVLIFDRTLDRWLNPEFYPSKPRPASPQTIEATLDVLRRQRPAARILGLRLPRDEWDALVGFSGNRAVHLDQGTGEVLGSRPRNEGFLRTVTRLHVSLLSGKTGGTLVAVATGIALGLALTGLWLWWPLRIFGVRRGKNFRRLNLDLHSVAGLYSSFFQLVIAGTGLTLHFFHADHPPVPRSQQPAVSRPRIAVDDAVAKAQAALPGARAVSCELPVAVLAPFRVQLAFPEDHSPGGRSVVFLDQYSGKTLGITSSREGTWWWRYLNLHLSIHTGGVFGWPSQWVALITCAALVLQIFSGYVLWWKRS